MWPSSLLVLLALGGHPRRNGRINLDFQTPARCQDRPITTTAATTADTDTVIQLNHAGASPSPDSVLERVRQHLELEQTVGGYVAAESVVEEMNGIYDSIARFIHASSSTEIALMGSATIAWTRIFYAMAERQRQLLDRRRNVILISDAEYAANVVAVCHWAKTHQWTVLSIPSGTTTITKADDDSTTKTTISNGIVDISKLQDMLASNYIYKENGIERKLDPDRIALVCITHVPTNSGIVNPVEEIGSMIETVNSKYTSNKNSQGGGDGEGSGGGGKIYYLVDACQSVGQLDVNVQSIRCHALTATGRKYIRGPRGTGFLYVESTVINQDNLMPSHVDHFGVPVQNVPRRYQDGDAVQEHLVFAPRPDARRFEYWEYSAACQLGFGKAVEYAMEKSIAQIQKDTNILSDYLLQRLQSIPPIHVHHPESTTCGIVTFHVPGMSSQTLKEQLGRQKFWLTVVPATSTPLDSAKTGVPDLVRASVFYTNTKDEIDSFIDALITTLE